jgi:hypothetical protein
MSHIGQCALMVSAVGLTVRGDAGLAVIGLYGFWVAICVIYWVSHLGFTDDSPPRRRKPVAELIEIEDYLNGRWQKLKKAA